MWVRHANTWCERWESNTYHDFFSGSHDGYCVLEDPVTHQRSIELLKNENRIIVTDTLTCLKSHTAETFWHFSEHSYVELGQNSIIAVNNGIKLIIKPKNFTADISLLHGDESRPAGWISRNFDTKQATTSAILVTKIDNTTCLRTEITWNIN
jgi:hypothetical protein